MTRGRIPTPTKLLQLRGSWRAKDRKDEPMPEVKTPKCPDWLDAPAKREWRKITRHMMAIGTAAEIDHALLENYCTVYSRWRAAEAKVRELGPVVKSPNGYPVKSPYLSIAEECSRHLKVLATELGLSPSARTRLRVEPKGDANDPFAQLIAEMSDSSAEQRFFNDSHIASGSRA